MKPQATTSEIESVVPEARHWGLTVAINTLNPFLAQVFTKVLMLGYLIVQYRLIGGGAGKLADYFLAGIVLMYTGTISDWGLSTLLTREVAKEGEGAQAAQLFRETLALRLIISLGLFLPVGLFVLIYLAWFGLSAEGAWVTLLLTLSLLPGAFSGSVTALLYARERMSPPAVVSIATSLLNVALGVGALLLSWGIIGLALAALISTLITALAFARILRRDFPAIDLRTPQVQGSRFKANQVDGNHVSRFTFQPLPLLKAGWPLMLNALLVGLFFRADQFIIKANQGDLGVERYQAAYSFLNFVLLITPAVTLALFPRMARHAENDRTRLAYEYTFALKMLLLLSVPLMALTIWFAPLLITIVTGARPEFLPSSAVALQILILFLPLSFINGVTQYVLIALNRQHLITWAFGATVLFNLAANLVLVPLLGINGAAIATIGSELVLVAPFIYWTAMEIGRVRMEQLAWKPILVGVIMALLTWQLWPFMERWQESVSDFAVYIALGMLIGALSIVTLALLKPLTQQELAGLRSALNRRTRAKE